MGGVGTPNNNFPEDEYKFWLANLSRLTGVPYNPDDKDYDYRKAFLAGQSPTRDSGWHWSSQYKSDTHPNRWIPAENGWMDTKSGEVYRFPQISGTRRK